MEISCLIIKIILVILVSIPAPISYFKKLNLYKSKFWLYLSACSIVVYVLDILFGVDFKFLVLDIIILVGYFFVLLENVRGAK